MLDDISYDSYNAAGTVKSSSRIEQIVLLNTNSSSARGKWRC